jgi:cell division septum initiation protein DivIVA
MEYKGRVYGKVGGKYIELTQTVEDLENEIKSLKEKLQEFDIKAENSKQWQLGVLKNIGKNMLKQERENTKNWRIVLDYFYPNTSTKNAIEHCEWLGVDPDAYTFFDVN